MKKTIALLLICSLFSGCASSSISRQSTNAPGYDKLSQSVEEIAVGKMKVSNVPGMAVVIVNQSQTLYEGNFGHANVSTNLPINQSTQFRIGSISKLFTATAIMQLYEAGMVDLDASASGYLPGFSINNNQNLEADDITVRAMLAHMSGLPTDIQSGFLSYDADEHLLDTLAATYLASEPYTVESYSNIGYNLLGRIIEAQTGMSYQQYLEQYIFAELAMDSATLGVTEQLAAGHASGNVVPYVELRDRAAGDLTMTASDLAKFAQSSLQRNPELLQAQTFNQMIEHQGNDLLFQSNSKQGLGWVLGYPGEYVNGVGEIIWHDGSIGSFRSIMLIDLENQLAAIVLSNSHEGTGVINQVAELALIEAIKSQQGDTSKDLDAPTWSKEQSDFTQAQLENLPGYYVSNAHGELMIERKGNKLYANVADTSIRLQAYQDGLIGADYHLFNLIPLDIDAINGFRFRLRNYSGQTLIEQMGTGIVAEKLKLEDLPSQWQARLGQYELPYTDNGIGYQNLVLEEYGGILRMYATVTVAGSPVGDVAAFIRPVSDNRAVLIGYGRGLGESLIFDGPDQFSYSGFTFEQATID